MNIAVVAANGRSGKAFVELALAAGHSVRGGVHGENTLTPHPQLTIVECDALQEGDVLKLIDGQDVVVSLIGHVKSSPKQLQTDTMRALYAAMQTKNISRLVSLTGTGVRFPGDKVTFIDWVLNTAISVIDPARIQDGKDHVAFLQHTDLDWTVVRVLKLQNVKPRHFSLKTEGPTKWFVGREEVAQAILQVIEQGTFIRQAPIISRK